MSHTTKLNNVVIRDVAALTAAVAELQAAGVRCELKTNAKPRMYYGNQHGDCDYVLSLKDSQYDVGFDRQKDGTFVPVFDEWNGHVSRQIGADAAVCPMPNTPEGRAQHAIGKFMQFYAKNAAINAAVSQGYMVEGAVMDDKGNCHLTIAGMM
jgi:hypothetical protein